MKAPLSKSGIPETVSEVRILHPPKILQISPVTQIGIFVLLRLEKPESFVAKRKKRKRVQVVGTGTIGEPIVHLFSETQKKIGIDETLFHKRTPLPEEFGKVKDMQEKRAQLIVDRDKADKFIELGLIPQGYWEDGLKAADVVIDCTPAGNENKEKYYLPLSRKYPDKGFIAQGSAEGFGKPYAWTINDCALDPKRDKWIQVVSCNTHQLVCILYTLLLRYEGIENLRYGHFTIVRRASDFSEDKGVLSVKAEIPEEDHPEYGTHQAYDAARVIQTLYPRMKHVPIFSQVVIAPTQYMHTMLFDLEIKSPIHFQEAKERLKSNPLVVFTRFDTTGRVLDRARNASKIHGRILNQTVFKEDTLNVSEDGTRIRGTCFTPQDGNALLSSVAATLWLLDPNTYKEKMGVFDKFLFKIV